MVVGDGVPMLEVGVCESAVAGLPKSVGGFCGKVHDPLKNREENRKFHFISHSPIVQTSLSAFGGSDTKVEFMCRSP